LRIIASGEAPNASRNSSPRGTKCQIHYNRLEDIIIR